MRVKVTRNFQVTIPTEIRERLGIRVGDYVDITYDEKEGVIIIRPYRKKWTTYTLGKKLTPEDIEQIINEVRYENANNH
ncbi:transcriptional regulator, AbrB family [Vulcanisaeta moutnovskia 768-28]|uniref:Transcriptional regulator, AbrB family n=1 Tax=Vulcanisaeta moutnovskia (strain 768-28) TaxID=985053 RepID=F0QYV4_VULM7|nr:AbrB/MazE/SpoVT family DNA-binding domain-containing protein [Vulcanisaeta moutnovskia]ADY00235.1 transcriptional regulator, AbrB family [Vulcanisaeta moutnovskia 768-28]